MREKKKYMVISFQTTRDAMEFERKCMDNAIPGRLIPVPREITAGCGLAWRISGEEYRDYADRIEALDMKFQQEQELML